MERCATKRLNLLSSTHSGFPALLIHHSLKLVAMERIASHDYVNPFDDLTPQQIRQLQDISDQSARITAGIPDKKQALLALYREIDASNLKQQAEYTDPPISCKKGCSFCCSIRVDATQLEVDVVVDYMKEKHIKVSENTLKHQSVLDVGEYFLSPHRKCTFLDDQGLCKIYPVRPFACRNYFVVSPPEHCDTTQYPKHDTLGVLNYKTVAMYNGALGKAPFGSFALMLLNTLKRKMGFLKP